MSTEASVLQGRTIHDLCRKIGYERSKQGARRDAMESWEFICIIRLVDASRTPSVELYEAFYEGYDDHSYNKEVTYADA